MVAGCACVEVRRLLPSATGESNLCRRGPGPCSEEGGGGRARGVRRAGVGAGGGERDEAEVDVEGRAWLPWTAHGTQDGIRAAELKATRTDQRAICDDWPTGPGVAECGRGGRLRRWAKTILTPHPSLSLSSLSLPSRVLHATQLPVRPAMILLDGLDKHDVQPSPKLVAEASSSSVPVTRPITPTPSLPPDYESSQAQLRPTTLSYPEIKEKRTRRRRCRRYTIYVLAAYFFLTVVIGLPILVVVRHFSFHSLHIFPPQPSYPS